MTPHLERKPPSSSSSIKVTEEVNGLKIVLPARGVRHYDIVGFALIGWGFMVAAVWTITAATGSMFLVLFSVPLWLLLGNITIAAINSTREIQTITIGNNRLTLTKTRPVRSDSYEWNFSEITGIAIIPELRERFQFRSIWFGYDRAHARTIGYPTVVSSLGAISFFEYADSEEQKWILEVLKSNIPSAFCK